MRRFSLGEKIHLERCVAVPVILMEQHPKPLSLPQMEELMYLLYVYIYTTFHVYTHDYVYVYISKIEVA